MHNLVANVGLGEIGNLGAYLYAYLDSMAIAVINVKILVSVSLYVVTHWHLASNFADYVYLFITGNSVNNASIFCRVVSISICM